MTTLIFSILGCSPDNKVSVYNEPPIATITSPVGGASFLAGDVVSLAGEVGDQEDDRDGLPLVVTWLAGSDEICPGTVAEAGLVDCAWTATGGTTQLTLRARDSAGETAEDTIAVTVTPDAPPDITILSPVAAGEYWVDLAVTLEAAVSDPESAPDALVVAWTSDRDGALAEVTPASSGTALATAPLSAGTHALTATVTDPGGATDVAIVSIVVYAENTAPSCVLTAPPDGTSVALGDAVMLGGSATDLETRPTALEVSLTSQLEPIAGAVTVDDAGAFTWPWTPSVPGTHVVSLSGEDSRGETCVDTLIVEVCDTVWYADADGDGYGDADAPVIACEAPADHVALDADCDDGDASVYPGAAFEESLVDCMQDRDGDGWGDTSVPAEVTSGADCDDDDGTINPDAEEVCDGVDNDCDGTVDGAAAGGAGTWYADADADGYGDPATTTVDCDAPAGFVADDDDCDDTRALSNPAATEYCNGEDDDCDGTTDEDAAADADTWYADADGDGYGDPLVTAVACAAPRDHVGIADDCDDSRALSNPAGTESCNGEDDDCDGTVDEDAAVDADTWYADTDGDGHGDPAAPRAACTVPAGHVADDGDCDDGDADTHPGADETCEDGIDQDCDGADTTCSASIVKYSGESAGDFAGISVSGAGDVNRDGYADLLVGAAYNDDGGTISGAAFLVLGNGAPASASLSTAVELIGEDTYNYAGRAVAGVGDVDGDGYDDVLVGAYGNDTTSTNAGAAYLVLGRATPSSSSLGAAVGYTGADAGDYAGYSVAAAGDVDDDGYPDMLIGAIYNDDAASNAGAVYLVPGGARPASSNLGTAVVYRGEAASDYAGVSTAGAGDVDGDGYDDILVGAFGNDDAGASAGAVYLVLGSGAPTSAGLAAAVQYTGEAAGDNAGYSVASAGDVDRDGYGDFLLGATGNDDGGAAAGAVFLVRGSSAPASGSLASEVQYTGEAAGDIAGVAVAGAGDVDGDGYPDLLLGAHYNDDGGSEAGAVYLVYGTSSPASQSLSLAEVYTGEAVADNAGYSLAGAGDVDADGTPDLLFGAFYNDGAGTDAGAAYLVLNP